MVQFYSFKLLELKIYRLFLSTRILFIFIFITSTIVPDDGNVLLLYYILFWAVAYLLQNVNMTRFLLATSTVLPDMKHECVFRDVFAIVSVVLICIDLRMFND